MRQAVDAANWIVEAEGVDPVFLKIYDEDATDRRDLQAAWDGVCAAAKAAVGPESRFALLDHRAIALTYMAPPWRPAFLHHLAEPGVLTAAIRAKRSLHDGAALTRTWNVFAEIDHLYRRAETTGIALPADVPALVGWSREAAAGIEASGMDTKPCHNDGSASSLLIDPAGAIRLVDFDNAGQSDPFYDLALTLNEAAAFGSWWERGIEIYTGSTNAVLSNRCRLYAAADDVFRGLWGHVSSAQSPRRTVEFLKYGEWRLLRARMALREAGFADCLHRL